MSDRQGVGGPSPIVPSTHRKGNFLVALLIEIPFVLFFSTLIGISVAWFLVMIDNYGMEKMPGLLVSIFERQGVVMLSIPVILTTLYFIITKVRGK
jgi:ABC-type multidrug transport system permease subunit